jgi:two-component system LytT family sensor kinase
MMRDPYYVVRENQPQTYGRNRLELYKNLLQPHFLFNSLNNLYALSIHRSEQTPEAIAGLSQLLERVVSFSRMDLVPLSEEIRLVEDYLSLEKIWLGESAFCLDLQVKGNTSDFCIPPLTIYTLVENAFKHGIRRNENKGWITVHLMVKNDKIILNIRNSFDVAQAGQQGDGNLQTGLGIEAVKKLLDGTYRKKYVLDARSIGNVFAVDLIICRIAA